MDTIVLDLTFSAYVSGYITLHNILPEVVEVLGQKATFRIPQIIQDPRKYESYKFYVEIYFNGTLLSKAIQPAVKHNQFETILIFNVYGLMPKMYYTGKMSVSPVHEKKSRANDRTDSDLFTFQTSK